MDYVLPALCVLLAYFIGSLNFSIIISKLVTKRDIRSQGSGSAGSTNALRVMGKKLAILVVLGDLLKGILAVLIGYFWLGENGKMFAAIGVILGHVYPAYFKFKGGKGIMTGLAVFLLLDWRIALIALSLFIIVVAATRYVSLGSMLASVSLSLLSLVFHKPWLYFALCASYALFVIFLHRSNISRLLSGTENKLGKPSVTR